MFGILTHVYAVKPSTQNIEHFHYLKSFLVCLCSLPPLHALLQATTDLFSVTVD